VNVRTLRRQHAPDLDEYARQIADRVDALAAAERDQVQAREDLDRLAEQVVDDFGGVMAADEYARRRADAERRLVAATAQVEHLTAAVAGLRRVGVEAAEAEIDRRAARVDEERRRIEEERRRLRIELARLDDRDERAAAKLDGISRGRLPLLARFDEDSAASLAAREKAEHAHVVQFAHSIVRGQDVDVPPSMVEAVAAEVPRVRADLAAKRQDERASLDGLYVRLDQHEQVDGPIARRGFADLDED
jgi:hypothetical protein